MQSLQLPTELRPGWYPGSGPRAQISGPNGTELKPTQGGRESRTGELWAHSLLFCNACVCLGVSKSGLFFPILSVCVCVCVCVHACMWACGCLDACPWCVGLCMCVDAEAS